MLTFNSNINSLIDSMNLEQREKFYNLIKEFEEDGLDLKLKSKFIKFTCSDILNSIKTINKFEEREKLKVEAVKNNTSTIPKTEWDVHETHCCSEHGCKYGDIDCPVEIGLIKQRYKCEFC